MSRLVDFYRLQLHLLWNWRPGRRALIRRAIISFVVSTLSLLLAIGLTPGITVNKLSTVIAAVLLLAALNLLVRPILLAAFAALNPVVLIIGTLVWQVAAFLVLGAFVDGLDVSSLTAAFLGSWFYAFVNTFLTAVLSTDDDESYWGALVRQMAIRKKDAIRTDVPGVVIVQIDGLAQPILAHQIRAGRVPFISRWVRSGAMKLDKWVALLPSQTSASQAGILHGNNSFIPAFRWWEKDKGRMMVSNRPEDAAEIVRRASNGEGLLSNDGASVGNLVSGDAVRSYITMATIRDRSQGLGTSATFYSFFASPYNYLHTIVLTVIEIAKEYVQARRAHKRGIEPIMHRGMPYPAARAGTNVALRALSTSLVMEEMFRGTPVIYVDYTDYDEIAHHSGPERAETLDALDGVDRTVRTLVAAASETPRPYRFILLSDHGQSLGATFRQRFGRTLQDVIADLMGGNIATEAATAPGDAWGPLNAALSEAGRTSGAAGAISRRIAGSSSTDGIVDMSERSLGGRGPREARRAGSSADGVPGWEPPGGPPKPKPGEIPELVVAASGNLALVFFPQVPGRVSLEEMERRWPGMVPALAAHPGIGFLMVRTESHGTVALGARGANYLDEGRIEGEDPVAPYGPHAITGLRRVDGMAHCGDLVAISLLDDETEEVAAFEELIGSHGGLGGPQTQPFILHPADWTIDEPLIGAEAVYRQIRRWLEANGIQLGKQPPALEADPVPETPALEAAGAGSGS
jgi:uncharacterized membrane protein YvlD (DUF360 family)